MAKRVEQLDEQVVEKLEQIERQLAQGGKQGGGFMKTTRTFVWGSAIGAGLALLFAPQSGEQTRQKLMQSSGQLKEQAQPLMEQAQQKLDQAKQQAQPLMEQAKQQVQSVASKAQDQAQSAASQAKDQAQSAASKAQDQMSQGSSGAQSGGTQARVVYPQPAQTPPAQSRS